MEDKIYNMLEQLRPEFDFRGSENFVDDGYLDSFDIVTLVAQIESEFGVMIDGLDILPENFETVTAIKSLIEKSGE